MLVALAAKNAILIFEFAVLNRQSGESVYDAAVTAATERLRPIVMTSLAFILGCVPLAVALGASANSRHSIGTGVIGGMLGATVIAVFFIPMFFYVLETMSERSSRGKKTPGRPTARRRQRGHRNRRGRWRDRWVLARAVRRSSRLPDTRATDMRAPALSLVAVLALGGCLLGPNYERPVVDTPATFRFAGPDAKEIVDTVWWEQFQDPVLNELIGIALAENKDLKIAAARVEQFLGQFQSTRSQLFPQAAAGFDAQRQRVPLGTAALPNGVGPVFNQFSATLSASWEIDVFGRLRRQTEAAARERAGQRRRPACDDPDAGGVGGIVVYQPGVARPATRNSEGHHRKPGRFGARLRVALQVRRSLADGAGAEPVRIRGIARDDSAARAADRAAGRRAVDSAWAQSGADPARSRTRRSDVAPRCPQGCRPSC